MQPRLIVVAGPNGSGKTTITEQMLRHTWMHGCLYINPDLMAQQQFGGWNDPAAIKQAADLATEQRENALADRSSRRSTSGPLAHRFRSDLRTQNLRRRASKLGQANRRWSVGLLRR